MTENTTENVKQQIAALDRMTVGELQQRYAEVFDEPARSANRQWLLRRVGWRIQMLAEGDLATRAMERARERAQHLARDADLRVRPPAAPPPVPDNGTNVASGPMHVHRDERIPPPGSVLTRRFKGHEYKVTVLSDGFEFDGVPYRSLSAVAHAITGSHWNGMYFFGLTDRKRKREHES